jgi:hypothetical protein
VRDGPPNNEMNRPNRGVPGMKERRPSGEPVLAEVGPPVILSLDVAGYFSVMRRYGRMAPTTQGSSVLVGASHHCALQRPHIRRSFWSGSSERM